MKYTTAISYLSFLFALQTPYFIEADNQKQVSSWDTCLQKSSTVACGIVTGISAHVLSEYALVYLHELGHAAAHKLTGGGSFTISVQPNTYFPHAICLPFAGKTNLMLCQNDNVTTLGGPIAGLSSSLLCLILANSAAAYVQKGKQNTDAVFFNKSFFTTFITLKTIRTWIEYLYGFTPLCAKGGDGHHLWYSMFKLRKKYSVSYPRLTEIATILALLPSIRKIF